MDNAPEKVSPISKTPTDDIPVAQREMPPTAPKQRSRFALYSVVGVLTLAAMTAGGLFSWQLRRSQSAAAPDTAPTTSDTTSNASPNASPTAGSLLGHFPYAQAPAAELEVVEGSVRMRKSAARAYRAMSDAARQSGVVLAPLSGFRTVEEQRSLYFDVKAERNQDARERAKVSAPPGYSEHHTGYAIDVGDGNVPATNLSQSFERTAAFRWLQQNAARFSFELSFPKGNTQGVMYEPWHWRYVGDLQSLKTFYREKANEKAPKP